MITSIELENWRTHKSTKLEFAKGTNVLIGMMGAGKSSIMDGISYAFFGTFPAIRHRKTSIESLITNRPKQEREARIMLTFTTEGNTYEVERRISLEGAARATLKKNGQYLQSQPERVTEEISKILKVDYDLFSRAIYSEQNGMDYFLRLKSKDRKEQIDELLGLDKFFIAEDNTATLINRIKDSVDEASTTAAGLDIDKLKGQLSEYENQREKLLNEKKSIIEEISHRKVQLSKIDAELKSMREQHNRKTELQRKIAEVSSRLDVTKSEIKKIEDKNLGSMDKIKERISELNSKWGALEKRDNESTETERKANSELSKIKADILHLRERKEKRDALAKESSGADLKKLESDMISSENHAQELEKLLASHLSKKEETEKWIAELKKHISKCPVCERDLTEDMIEKLLEGKSSLLKEAVEGERAARTAISEERKRIDVMKKRLDELRLVSSKLNDYEGIDAKLAEQEARLAPANAALDESRREMERIKKEKNAVNEEKGTLAAAYSDLERMERYMADAKQLKASADRLNAEISNIVVDDKKLEELEKASKEASSTLAKFESEFGANTNYIKEKELQISDKKEEISKVDEIFNSISTKKAAIEDLYKFREALRETQIQMRNRLVGSINSVMQEIWPELYPYTDYAGIRLEAEEGDYTLKLLTTPLGVERWEEVESVASGGERSIACLAMRIAFALVLAPNLKWLILDEPTHNIDQDGLSKFITVFNDTLPKIVDQIFIITHDEKLKQASNARIYLLTRNKGESKPTDVDML